VILLPDVREVDVTDLILMVESDQKSAVTNRNVTRHEGPVVPARSNNPFIMSDEARGPLKKSAGTAQKRTRRKDGFLKVLSF
jgi:hypothetical protein